MPFLAWLGSLGTAISAWFARKGITVAAYSAAFFGVLVTYYALMHGVQQALSLLNVGIVSSSPVAGGSSIDWMAFIAMFAPDNMDNCIVIIFDAYIARVAMIYTHRYIQGIASAQ